MPHHYFIPANTPDLIRTRIVQLKACNSINVSTIAYMVLKDKVGMRAVIYFPFLAIVLASKQHPFFERKNHANF